VTIAFLGLGNMGSAMAHRLLQAGYPLRVWNRSPVGARICQVHCKNEGRIGYEGWYVFKSIARKALKSLKEEP